jgi:hypothetical protein
MKCSHVRKEIDRLIYRDDPDPGAEIQRHIGSCKSCAQYLQESSLASRMIDRIRQREPILKNPDGLADEIMNMIRDDSKVITPDLAEKSGKSATLKFTLRWLAAASVCLFLVFGYEEYVVVDKISSLEKQIAAISQSSHYHAALQLKKAMSILASDPEMQNQYKDLKSRKMYFSTFSPVCTIFKQIDSTHQKIKR